MLDKKTRAEYRRLRDKGWHARQALWQSRTIADWDNLDGFTFDSWDERDLKHAPGDSIYTPGPIRLRLVPEEGYYDDSFIDTWTDATESQRAHYRKDLWNRIKQDGVWGLIGEYWDGADWEHADSCWGFIGDDWRDSGSDADIMRATIDAYQEHLAGLARELEATRPDMYGDAA